MNRQETFFDGPRPPMKNFLKNVNPLLSEYNIKSLNENEISSLRLKTKEFPKMNDNSFLQNLKVKLFFFQ